MHFEKKYPCPSSLWQHVASAALLLASKVEEAAVPIERVLKVTHNVWNRLKEGYRELVVGSPVSCGRVRR